MRLPFVLAVFLLCAGLPLRAQHSSEHPLHELIPELFGVEVLPYDGSCLAALEDAAQRTLAVLQTEGVTAGRPNEVGNEVEDVLQQALIDAGFAADLPTARSGRQRSAGYPDLEAGRDGHVFYIEVKTYHPRTEESSYRTLYLSPSRDPKVTQPAMHLLFAFAMVPEEDDTYHAKSARIIDLHDLVVTLKMEYSAGNDDLYGEESALEILVLEGELQGAG